MSIHFKKNGRVYLKGNNLICSWGHGCGTVFAYEKLTNGKCPFCGNANVKSMGDVWAGR